MLLKCQDIQYVLIQAGGLGTRMCKYTENKSKCLVPYNGKTMIQHNIDFFKDKKIFIITDYKKELLTTYIQNVLNYKDITFIETNTKSTTAGLNKFFELIGDDEPFIFCWSDLIFEKEFSFSVTSPITVMLTDNVKCRWSVKNNEMIKETSETNGIFGGFIIQSKKYLKNLDENKSFVGGNLTLLPKENIGFVKYNDVLEIGTVELYEKLLNDSSKCRFFNNVVINEDYVLKECVNQKYSNLIENEIDWYTFLGDKVNFVPKLLSTNPMKLTKINGKHIFDNEWSDSDKNKIIDSIIAHLNDIHSLGTSKSIDADINEIYFNKTIDRVNSVKVVIPFINDEKIKINGILYENPFYGDNHKNIYEAMLSVSSLISEYNVIHGDPTFSNMLVDDECNTFFIDPRGLFGNTKIYGDKNYDWAKLFYSVNGNYDSINSKKFNVTINQDGVELQIKSNNFENLSNKIILASGMNKKHMFLHQSLIWFSLTGYVKEDIDAIMYSFYYGVKQWNLAKD
jgi:NDP-sugar pyrophosphorylase family protein